MNKSDTSLPPPPSIPLEKDPLSWEVEDQRERGEVVDISGQLS